MNTQLSTTVHHQTRRAVKDGIHVFDAEVVVLGDVDAPKVLAKFN